MKIKKMRPVLFLILAGLNNLTAKENGDIAGFVIDADTKQPLFGTNVLIEGTVQGAATDDQGGYRIDDVPVGTYHIRFTYIGYEPLIKTDIVVKSTGITFVNAELSQKIVQGQEVTVTAGYFNTQAATEPSIIELSREEIRRFPGGFEDIVRTVSTLPGVAINASGGRNDILVRGGGPSENLYLINSIEVPTINHFGTQGTTGGSLSFINLDFVEDVNFSTGGFGARYGDKMSSVISLTMVKKRPDRFGGKAFLSATQYGFGFETPVLEKGDLIFSARKSYLDLIFKAAGLPFVPIYTDFNILGQIDLSPEDRLLFVGFSAIDEVDRDQSSLENRTFNAGLLDNTQYKGITGLSYRRLLPKGYADLILSANLSRYRFSQIDENEEEYFNTDADEWEYTVKTQYFRSFYPNLNMLLGLSAKQIKNENRTVFADTIYDRSGNRIPLSVLGLSSGITRDASGRKFAGYLEMEWIPFARLSVNSGIRADYYDFIDSPLAVAPRLSVEYRINPLFKLKASTGIYYQAPSYVWVINTDNSRLSALQNRMFVLGGEYLLREDTRLTIEGYAKMYSDLPTGTIPGVNDYIVITNTGTSFGGREDDFQSFGYYTLVSEGEGESRGAEISIQKKFSNSPFFGLISVAYNESKYKAHNGITYPGQYDQKFILNLSGGAVLNDKWEVSAKFRYFTGVPYTPVYRPSENPVNEGDIVNLPAEYLSARLDPGHHLDIRVDRYFNFPNLTLIVYADIQNVYDYNLPVQPGYDFWNDKIDTENGIGILPSIGVSLEF
jgi:hypothetical protein